MAGNLTSFSRTPVHDVGQLRQIRMQHDNEYISKLCVLKTSVCLSTDYLSSRCREREARQKLLLHCSVRCCQYTCGYGEKYQGRILCLPSSIISTFFIRVTMSSWCATMEPVLRGQDAVPLAMDAGPDAS
jgi:hypothetical protein